MKAGIGFLEGGVCRGIIKETKALLVLTILKYVKGQEETFA